MYLFFQREEEAQKEAQVRRRMEEEIKEQRSLIDALTAECLTLREESAALQVSCSPKVLLFFLFCALITLLWPYALNCLAQLSVMVFLYRRVCMSGKLNSNSGWIW